MRRIAIFGPYPPPWGGIAVHVKALRQLASRRGVACEVVDTGWAWSQRDGSDGVHPGGSPAGLLAGVARMRHLPIHVHIPGNNLKSWLVALATGRPLRPRGKGAILSVHSGLAPELIAAAPMRELARAAVIGFERVLCASEAIAASLERAGAPTRDLQVIPAFVPGAVEPAPLAAAVERRRAEAAPLLAAALAEGHQYGADVLLAGLGALVQRWPGLVAAVFGPGTDGPEFLRQVEAAGLLGHVEGLGELEHPVALAVLQAAELFIRPTRADGDSVSVREALRLGTRVLASDACPRPGAVSLFRSGDGASLAAAAVAALQAAPPAPGADECGAEARIWEGWSAIGVADGSERAGGRS